MKFGTYSPFLLVHLFVQLIIGTLKHQKINIFHRTQCLCGEQAQTTRII